MVSEVCVNNALLDAAKEVFETMIFMEIAETKDDKQIDQMGLLASITFKGHVEGCFAICCNMACCQAITRNMLGMEPNEELTDDGVYDALGEVANMLMGSTKTRLMSQFGDVEVSIPSVITGRQLQNNLGEGTKKLVTKINIQNEHVAELSLLYRETSK